ncbi:hypothetical protein [Pseudorhodoplanes sp.]|uniref:hypothetical protein n=1 Tax=Pseudorhodoplanes sp. TaxID=1934341 RepID=UPI002B59F905|nr:hypothetical protein [Pseudorhodoplanes sp.]HWV44117.1 hypothetical protein [Pseudorhodoplanes sp.]
MLTVLTWWWGQKYGPEYVYRLKAGLERHLKQPHRFLCVTDRELEGVETTPIKDPGLTKHPGCIVRLRIFDEVWQRDIGATDRIVCMDLDSIVTGPLDPLFDREEPFIILQGVNSPTHPCPYNGSIFMLRAGYRPDVWDDFTLEKLDRIPRLEFPDDQGWMHAMIPDAAAYRSADGVYAFQKLGWPGGDVPPLDARLVAFPGRRDPAQFTHLKWVREHWRE